MNDFERFGIHHLSPSSLNTFRHSPAHWATRYLLKVKDEESVRPLRGKAVEFGVQTYFLKQSDPEADQIAKSEALRSFDTAVGQAGIDISDVAVTAERNNVCSMLTQALVLYMGDVPPKTWQIKVEDWIDEAGIPMIGFIDFVFPDTIDEFKSVKAMPAKPTSEHLRQLSLYHRNRKEKPRIVYVTAKKGAIYEPDPKDLHDAWDGMVRDACAVKHLLSKCESPLDVIRMLPVDHTDYVWSTPTLQAALSAQTHIALSHKGDPDVALLAVK